MIFMILGDLFSDIIRQKKLLEDVFVSEREKNTCIWYGIDYTFMDAEKKFEFWISLIRQQIFSSTLWNSQMMESFISDFYSEKIKKKSKVETFSLSKGKIKLFERPQTIGGESSMIHSPLKDFFDTWENEKNQIEPPFYNCDELELPF